MSFIQDLRDKYAKVAVIAVGLAMLGFIMMDAFSSRSRMFGRKQVLGEINGTKIDVNAFNQVINYRESQVNNTKKKSSNDASRMQVINDAWNDEVRNVLLGDEYKKLGLAIGAKEMDNMLFGSNPPAFLAQQFTDPKTGIFNATAAQQAVRQLKASKDENTKMYFVQMVSSLENETLEQKYLSLVYNSVNYPKWYIEERVKEESKEAKVALVKIPYTQVLDNEVKISDKDIEKFINAHKEEFKVSDSRNIAYILFNAAASSSDSLEIRNATEAQIPEFSATEDPERYTARAGSAVRFKNVYLTKKQILNQLGLDSTSTVANSFFTAPVGNVVGPVLVDDKYVLSKKISEKTLPDSVKCRHILIATMAYNQQTQQQTRILEDTVARVRADSIARAIRSGASFVALEELYSADQAAHQQKGEMTFSTDQIQSDGFDKDFAKFVLNGKPGQSDVVKTQFGYHYIEIMKNIDPQPRYEIAFLAKLIFASSETDNTANNAANKVAGVCKTDKDLVEYIKKNPNEGLRKFSATDIRPEDYMINGLGSSRSFIKAVFGANLDEAMPVYRVEDNYVVAVVTDIYKKGIATVDQARSVVEPVLINKEKAKILETKIGSYTSLDEVSTKMNSPVITVDTLRMNDVSQVLGYELKVIGAAFDPKNTGKLIPKPIAGQQGVYVLKVESLTDVPTTEDKNISFYRQYLIDQTVNAMMSGNGIQGGGYDPTEVLKKEAKITDNRTEFY